MKLNSTRERLLGTSMICGAAILGLSATSAAAQQASPSSTAQVSEIVVTGSRIPTPNLTSTSPLSVVSSQEVKLQGATSIETVLQNLPSVVPEFNQGVDNGASGTATVALRGLGSNRTLVLVDGYRLMPGDPLLPSPDLNNIPAALVDRVEVVTGGASAVYGSDAVAGVVNFILQKNFEGVRFDSTYSFAVHNNDNSAARNTIKAFNTGAAANNQVTIPGNKIDAQIWDFNALFGINSPDGKGNITAYAGYRHINPLTQDRRDVGACSISTIPSLTTGLYDSHVCQGSSNSAFGRFVNFGVSDNPAGGKTFVPFNNALSYNFAPLNYYQQDDTRYTAGYFAHYEVNPMVELYSNFMFADDKEVTQQAPSGLFSNSGPVYTINCANPLMSASQRAVICGPGATIVNGNSTNLQIAYRFANLPRVTAFEHTAYTTALGSRGKLGDHWTYDAHLQFGHTNYSQVFTGDVSIAKINDALNVVNGANGPVCASGNAGCVPLDIFQALSAGITPAAAGFVGETAFKQGYTEERIASFNVTGDLSSMLKSPWADDGVGVALGTEYRSERLNVQVSSNFATGDLSGAGGANPPGSGGFDVYELFGEARVPLVQNMPFVDNLSVELGYRYADYSLSGTVSAYKASAEWKINPDVRLRGGYNRAVRAPNIVELFTPQTVGNGSFNDPCAGATPAANCARTFSSPAQAAQFLGKITPCPAAQCSQLFGGNPALKPEVADTWTAGVVFTPRFLPGFNASLDYFLIKVDQPVTAGIGSSLILSQCLSTGSFCGLIHRDPITGGLFGITTNNGYVEATSVNSGSLRTSGFDGTANYRMELGDWGGLSFNYVGTYTREFISEPVTGLGKYDCVGYFGPTCGEPQPKYKHQLRATWTTPWSGVQLSANWRYLHEVKLDFNEGNDPFLGAFGPGVKNTIDAKIPSYSYLDLAANWKVGPGTLRVGVNNVFDKDPPQVDANVFPIAGTVQFGNGNTFPGVYDAIGRTVFVGFTADF